MDKQKFIEQAAVLLPAYKANDQVAAQLSHINLIAIVGPSGAGKSTITRQSGLPFVVGDTTRTMREGEIHGRDYNFRADFDQLLTEVQQGEFVQYVIQRETDFYGTKATSFPASGACAMSIIATAIPTFKSLGFNTVVPVYIVPPNHTEWMRRLGTHRDKDLEARLMEAKESLVAALNDPSYVFILNDNLDAAVMTIRKVASGTIDPTASARARSSANTLYEHLQKVIR